MSLRISTEVEALCTLSLSIYTILGHKGLCPNEKDQEKEWQTVTDFLYKLIKEKKLNKDNIYEVLPYGLVAKLEPMNLHILPECTKKKLTQKTIDTLRDCDGYRLITRLMLLSVVIMDGG